MANEFFNLQLRMHQQKIDLTEIRSAFTRVTAPNFKPIEYNFEGFSAYTTPAKVAEYILGSIDDNETTYQALKIKNAIDMMQQAMLIVEAQLALNLKVDPEQVLVQADELRACIDQDKQEITELFKYTTDTAAKQRAREHGSQVLEDPAFAAHYASVMDDFHSLADSRIDRRFMDMSQQELIQKIAQMRVEYAHLVINNTDNQAFKMRHRLGDALYLIKARDEGIIPANPYLEDEINNRLDYVKTTLPVCEGRFRPVERFMAAVEYMRGEAVYKEDRKQEFTADRYHFAPLRMAREITP